MYCVEGFRHVQCHCNGPVWGLFLVEALCNCVGDVVQCCGGGVLGFESVLVVGRSSVVCDVRKYDLF